MKIRCSDTKSTLLALNEFQRRLKLNGFQKTISDKIFSNKTIDKSTSTRERPIVLTILDYVSGKCTNRINKILKNYDFPVKLVNKTAQISLKQCFNGNRKGILNMKTGIFATL